MLSPTTGQMVYPHSRPQIGSPEISDFAGTIQVHVNSLIHQAEEFLKSSASARKARGESSQKS